MSTVSTGVVQRSPIICPQSVTLTVVHRVEQAVRPEDAQQLQGDHPLHQRLCQRCQRFGRHLRGARHTNTTLLALTRGQQLSLIHHRYT